MSSEGGLYGFSSDRIGLAAGMSILAGACTIIGALAIYFEKIFEGKHRMLLAIGLAFSGGVMLEITYLEVLFKAFEGFGAEFDEAATYGFVKLSFLAGLVICGLLQGGVDYLLGRQGVHGLHDGDAISAAATKVDVEGPVVDGMTPEDKQDLKQLGLLSALAIALHNVPEGLAVFVATLIDPNVGGALVIGVAIHNIPEGMAVAYPIYYSSGSKCKAIGYAALSGIAEPIGGCIGFLIFGSILSDVGLGVVFGVVAGMMLYIVIFDLLPTAYKYGDSVFKTGLWIIAGVLVMGASLVLFRV